MSHLRTQFRKWQINHPNFMTPNILRIRENNGKIIELSSGRGIEEGTTIYGVTVLEMQNNGTFKSVWGSPFHDYKKAVEIFNKFNM